MSGNNQDFDNQNDDSQNYDDDNQEDQEYDSQDDNSQNNGDDDCEEDGDNGDDNDGNDDDENEDGPKYIRLRGLPWSATHKEILDFLKNINVVGGAEGIHIVTRRWDGVNSGEAYVELKSQKDADAAMKLDNANMGHRYIEVFNATASEAKDAMRKTSSHGVSYVVKLRGLPFSVNEQQVEEFFKGLEIKPDREGIIFVMDRRGRATGEAFVQFESQEDTEQALGRNRQKIGHRYIEIFRSSFAELKRYTVGNNRVAPYDLKERGGNRGGNGSDFGGGNRNNRGWGNNGGFGVGANNTLGFNNIPNFGNTGNFGNNGGGGGGGGIGNFGNFSNNGGGGGDGGGMGNFGNFGNNGGGNFGNNNGGGGNFGNNNGGGGNFGNNSGGGNNGGGFNRFSGNSGNFGNDFGDFDNFGNDRGNNGMGGGGGNNNNNGSGFNNFSNFGNNMGGGGGGGFGNNMGGGGGGGGGNFGPIGGGRNDDYYMIMMRGLPFTSFENDVFKFFEPIRPANVRIHYSKQSGRHNGTAEALFDNYEDALLAMKRHRCKMGTRYIELFSNGKAKLNKGGNNYSPGGGNMGSGNGIGVGGGMGGGAFSRRI